MAKNNNTIFWIIGIAILLLVVSQLNLNQQEEFSIKVHYYDENKTEIFPVNTNNKNSLNSMLQLFSIIPYETQCDMPSCSSPYSQVDVSCDDELNKCFRKCDRTAQCGTYASSTSLVSTVSTQYSSLVDSATITTSSNNCYAFTVYGSYNRNSGTTNYYNVKVENNIYLATSPTTASYVGGSTNYIDLVAGAYSYITASREVFIGRGNGNNYFGRVYFYDADVHQTHTSITSLLYQRLAPWLSYDSITYSCDYIPEIAYISLEILVTNTGDIDLTDVKVVDASPIEFLNALDISNIRVLNKGSSTTWYSNNISVKPEWKGTTQTFEVYVNGTIPQTGEIITKSSQIQLAL